ncbi:ligase-associated DNA damage response exonuclease [Segetibacter sp.]|jgi:putative mRNA 3-end processing factor|uniref:ligase-associated DNA damage response exonuclease n=1 Tax=Segetibacter sp. TaxID=2231182 RepID=UPI002626E34E|nr:ligase-associated DNA damage response exonuclease [Segetibacter sp.]MCW3080855.1 ligase-associated damage response exonuclease [Segetibacter sp.]
MAEFFLLSAIANELLMPLIEFSDKGLCCPQGQFYIDPWKPVDKALITHGHSDHARWGSQSYLCHRYTKPILQLRLGDNAYQTVEWGETIFMNGVKISFHPAGHVIGSSQIRLEYKGEVWVVSGDYKVVNDGLSGQFEAVPCNTFITESTFGLPIYKWKSPEQINKDIQIWIQKNTADKKTSVITAYSLGKAQRVIQAIAEVTEKIYVHGAIFNIHETLVKAGWKLPQVHRITHDTAKVELAGSVVVAPPSADGSSWMKRFPDPVVGVCSGWMQVRGNARRRNVDAGFVMSDHADWPGLLQAVKATGAEKVFVTHGFQATFSRYLNELGIEAGEVKTEYGNDEEEGLTPSTAGIEDVENPAENE